MPPARSLTPPLALDYVHELSADVRAGVVLDAEGELLAGAPFLAAPARDLLRAAGDAAEVESVARDGVVCAVRSGGHAAVAVCGRFALPGVVRRDLRVALAALDGESLPHGSPPPSGPGDAILEAAARAALTAVQSRFRT
jgi:hypothetical protein